MDFLGLEGAANAIGENALQRLTKSIFGSLGNRREPLPRCSVAPWPLRTKASATCWDRVLKVRHGSPVSYRSSFCRLLRRFRLPCTGSGVVLCQHDILQCHIDLEETLKGLAGFQVPLRVYRPFRCFEFSGIDLVLCSIGVATVIARPIIANE